MKLFIDAFLFLMLGCVSTAFASDLPRPKIPKIIHYVWLGSEKLPEKVEQAIQTWKHFQPDYQIKRWDEHNCDLHMNKNIYPLYRKKIYIFVSDWCKIQALQEGGVYLDTDMFLKAPIDPLLDKDLVLTTQNIFQLSASFMAVTPNHPFVMLMKKYYQNIEKKFPPEAPRVWTDHFIKLYHEKDFSAERKARGYHIYTPNIFMYDFQGGETVAEHMFASGSPEAESTEWYNIFRHEFLLQYAFYMPKQQKFFILKDQSSGYFYADENPSDTPKIAYNFKLYRNFLKITSDQNTTYYFCRHRRCRKLLQF